MRRFFYNTRKTCTTMVQEASASLHTLFRGLEDGFLNQFTSSKSTHETHHLWSIIREKEEALRSYLTRFNASILELQAIRSPMKVDIFTHNLKYSPLFASLIKRPLQCWEELLSRTDKFIHLEDFVLEQHLENTTLKAPSKPTSWGRKDMTENSRWEKETREIWVIHPSYKRACSFAWNSHEKLNRYLLILYIWIYFKKLNI